MHAKYEDAVKIELLGMYLNTVVVVQHLEPRKASL